MNRRTFIKNMVVATGGLLALPLLDFAKPFEIFSNQSKAKNSMKTLFDKTRLGHLTLKNRAWRSATWLALADKNGHLTEGIINTYEELAKGEVAVIVTGLTSVVAGGAAIEGGAKFYDDSFIAEHRRLTEAVHRHGAYIMMQTAMVDGQIDSLSTEQVERLIHLFGDAARRAEQAGYDGVQIHVAHFFYLSKFISPLFNHRKDRFGGNQQNRTRIIEEILHDMRSKTSKNFVITMKINSSDNYAGGLDIDGLSEQDFLESSIMMANAGIDAIEVSGNNTSRSGIRAGQNEGYFCQAAATLAQKVNIPIVLVGGLRSVEKINQILNETSIQYVSLSRPLICEPNLIQRWGKGDTKPSKCISCNACYNTFGHQCIFNMNAEKR